MRMTPNGEMQPKTTIMTGMSTTLSDEHLIELGTVAVHASRLEFAAAELAAELLDPKPEVGFALTTCMTFERLLALVHSLIELRVNDPQYSARFEGVRKLAESAMRERNRLMHGHWVVSWNHATMRMQDDLATRARRGRVEVRNNVVISDIKAVADDLNVAHMQIELLHANILRPLGRLVEFEPGKFRRAEDAR
ncbi:MULTISPECIES: hypothetical protein [unclassified Arthrobacter]|uniref:hypothetical protein n=1 Tax=unclassified Arthrobacter TaxID=235627 RepID=UPI001CFF9BF5|nr:MULTISPECIES: hypothetical protein [unclassified Arthrobacter]MCB5282725.1 hypothetical protein [Arthrobacter sp. ES1]WGZ79088.1 hypothetical protein QI450_14690 [Arthrobacter sp. EM1]